MAFVGMQEHIAKAHDILVRVLAQPQWKERNWIPSLYCRGADTQDVKAMAKMLGIDERFTLTPSYASIQEVCSQVHVLVMASRYEGLPLALVKAMTLGRPAVVTNVADCNILLCHQIDVFVASAPTVAAYTEAMERLWQHR